MKLKRFVALMIDGFIIATVYNLLIYIIFGEFIYLRVLEIGYICLIMLRDLTFRNQSIGKKLLNLEVISVEGTKPSILQLILRNVTTIIWPIEE